MNKKKKKKKLLGDFETIIVKEVKFNFGKPSNNRSANSGYSITKKQLRGIVNKSPEVMMKITSFGKNTKVIGAHLDYISRNGKIELENNEGEIISDRQDRWQVADDFVNNAGVNKTTGTPFRASMSAVMSMPKGVNPEKLKDAARDALKVNFPNHDYVFALHADTDKPHVHFTVSMRNLDKTKRLNPKKIDLQTWRENFADKLNDHGIDANATPAYLRGKEKRRDSKTIKMMQKHKKRPKVIKKMITDAKRYIERGEAPDEPWKNTFNTNLNSLKKDYAKIVRDLGKEDKELADQTLKFLNSITNMTSRKDNAIAFIKKYDKDFSKTQSKKKIVEGNKLKQMEKPKNNGMER